MSRGHLSKQPSSSYDRCAPCCEFRFERASDNVSPNQVLTHAARAAAEQPHLVAARGAREGLWLEQDNVKQCDRGLVNGFESGLSSQQTAFRSH